MERQSWWCHMLNWCWQQIYRLVSVIDILIIFKRRQTQEGNVYNLRDCGQVIYNIEPCCRPILRSECSGKSPSNSIFASNVGIKDRNPLQDYPSKLGKRLLTGFYLLWLIMETAELGKATRSLRWLWMVLLTINCCDTENKVYEH